MIRHIICLMWARKKTNGLIFVELMATFFVLFAVVAVCSYHYRLYQTPLGFEVENTWGIETYLGRGNVEGSGIVRQQLVARISQIPGVKSVHVSESLPFGRGSSRRNYTFEGKDLPRVNLVTFSTGAPESLGVSLLSGRWFGPEDEGQDWHPILINRHYRETTFADTDPLGLESPPRRRFEKPMRIVGVFEDLRYYGEFMSPGPFVIERYDLDADDNAFSLAIITDTATGVGIEQGLHEALAGSPEIEMSNVFRWTELQRQSLAVRIGPLLIMLAVAAFLIVMVSLGLFGVLWQNITRRTGEIGTRRAMGASANAVIKQIVLETVCLSVFAVAVGVTLLIQLPISGLFPQLGWELFWQALVISALLICGLSAVCALYPSWLAARVDPVDALHYE